MTRLGLLISAVVLAIAAPATAVCQEGGRRAEGYIDAGMHGYLVEGKTMLGLQVGGGQGPIAGQFEFGLIYNDERLEQYDTTFLGPYFGLFVYGFVHRSPVLDLKVGIGGELLSASEIASSLDFGALVLSAVAHYNVLPHVSVFVRADALPLRADGLIIRGSTPGVPLIARVGFEWTSAN